MGRVRLWRSGLYACLVLIGLGVVGGLWATEDGSHARLRAESAPPGDRPPPKQPPRSASGQRGTSRLPRSIVIRRSPVGLSIEYPLLKRALGRGPCPSKAFLGTLLGLGSPTLRIGGDSQDLAGPSHTYRYYVPPSFWTTLGCLARETGAQIVVGLNFGEGTIADAKATIAAAERAIPSQQLSFSLGNEPDLYGTSHTLAIGRTVVIPALRARSWSPSAYMAQWKRWRARIGPIRFEGPDMALSSWGMKVRRLLRSDPPDELDAHFYPMTACEPNPGTTNQGLLTRKAGFEVARKLGWLLAEARRLRRRAVISESNSVACGGMPGVSNTPVASVWAVRFTIGALLAGFEQVRFHSSGGSYDPFVFGSNGSIAARPLAAGLEFLHRWLAIGSRVTQRRAGARVFAVTVTHDRSSAVIASSFSPKAVSIRIPIAGGLARAYTETLTPTNAKPVQRSRRVHGHAVMLTLQPNTVVALRTS